MKTIAFEVDGDGVALITLDDPDRPMNVVSPQWVDEMIEAIERVAADDAIVGAVITSAKPAFMAGADLKYILATMESGISLDEAVEFSRHPSVDMHRRLETCGKPFVAAINGLALGGGFELCLACHRRILVDSPQAAVGLPEATVGLMAGSGGTQRLPRMIGIARSLDYIVDGKTAKPTEAFEAGLVDEVVPADRLLDTARAWIRSKPEAVRAWDRKGYRVPEGQGLLNSGIAASYSLWTGKLAAKTRHNYPAPIANLDVVFEGTLLPFDRALALESKRFAQLLTDPVARNIVRTSFVNKGLADRLARRPEGIAKSEISRIGVLGGGLMGSGIAYVGASGGLEVVLLDIDEENAAKGKAYSEKLLATAVERGRRSREQADAILARIRPTADYADLAGCELVIEAVFEDRAIKADVTRRAEAVLADDAIFASNTSTLPISSLAEASSRPERFIGLHFFSPVDKMPLIEVIRGEQTSDETLARALDAVARLKMTPILVNDSRGFYTSRVFQTFIHEGMQMLEDGVEPALIENAAKIAGMPMGPLALLDEVTISLPWKVVQQSIDALGDAYTMPSSAAVMRRMLEQFDRPGRRAGGGFYDYPDDGPKRLWPGLAEAWPPAPVQPMAAELGTRFLYIQALETARCLEEGVLTHAADGDLGAVMGWGFPLYTGGTLSLIDTVGVKAFVDECDRLARCYGERFRPSAWLRERAASGTPFHSLRPQPA